MTTLVRATRSVGSPVTFPGRRLVLAAAAFLVLAAAVVHGFQDHRVERRYHAVPLALTVLTDGVMTRDEVIRHIEPRFVTSGGRAFVYAEHEALAHDQWTWLYSGLLRGIEIDMSPGYDGRVTAVLLTVGDRDVPVTLSEPQAAQTEDGRKTLRRRLVLPESEIRRSLLRPGETFVNWPGDGVVLGRIGRYIAVWGGLLGLILLVSGSRPFLRLCERRLASVLPEQGAEEAAPGGSGLWLVAGLGVVAAALAALQWRDPWYFTQDDNFSQFFPVILAGGQSLLAGMLFDYNPLQLLGAPTVEVGTYALTYPGTYLAFLVARLAGNETLTLEIFCIAHLLPGFAATWWAARRWGAGGAAAAALGVCFVLSGYALAAGRSWYYMTPVFLWLPLAMAALHGVLFRERKIRDTVLLAASLGLLFHAGNAQMWVYAAGLVAVLALLFWLREGRPRRPFIHLSAAGIGALALAMPLLLLQFGFAAETSREGGSGITVTQSLSSLFLPLPLGATDMNFRQSADFLLDVGPLFYSGPLLIPAGLLIAAVAAAAWLGGRTGARAASAPALFALAGTVALLLTFGFDGPLWFIHTGLPVLEKFNHPIKLLPFAVLLLGLGAVLGWERLTLPARTKARLIAAFTLGAFGLMVWNAMRTPDLAFYRFADNPYPGAPVPVTTPVRHEGRLFPVAPERSAHSGFPASGQLNFPMIYGRMSFWGYDPIIWTHPGFREPLIRLLDDPLAGLRAYGVDRLIVWQEPAAPITGFVYSDALRTWQADVAALIRAEGVPVPDMATTRRLRGEIPLADAKPLAFAAHDPSRSWPVTVDGPRVVLSLGAEGWPGGELVLNFLAWPRIVVTADGRKVPVRADEFGRVVAAVPQGAGRVVLAYRIDWWPGLAVAVALLGLAAYGVWRFDGRGRIRREQG